MKPFLALLVVLSFWFSLLAVNPSRTAVDAPYDWELDQKVSDTASFRSLTGTDSIITIATNWKPKKGFEYVMTHDSLTGSGTDSIAVQWRVDTKNDSNQLVYRTVFDTTATADSNGQAIIIPIGHSAIGHKFDVSGITYTGHSTDSAVTFNRIYIFRRRPVTIERTWSVDRK